MDSRQTLGQTTFVSNNLLKENGSGLAAASGGSVVMVGNDLSQQFPRLLDGDITQQYRAVVADLEEPLL